MKLLSLIGLIASIASTEAAVLQPRGCAADNCLRAVRNTNFPTRGLTDCSSFFSFTTAAAVSTITTTATITGTTTATTTETATETTTQTSYVTSPSTSITVIPVTTTITQPTTVFVTTAVVTTVEVSYGSGVQKRDGNALPTTYASQCGFNVSRFSSACACLTGFLFPTVTTTPTVTSTVTSTITSTVTSAVTSTVTSTIFTTNIVVSETVESSTTVFTSTVFSTATSTVTSISSTVTLTAMYIQAKDSTIEGQYIYNASDPGPGIPFVSVTHFSPFAGERTLMHLNSDTGYLSVVSSGWIVFIDSDNFPTQDILTVFFIDPAYVKYYHPLVCSLSGEDLSCAAGLFTEFGWIPNADYPDRPDLEIGKNGVDFQAEQGTSQVHLRAVSP
ncbi:hypothetical protein TWF694_005838 [Orbilia ellipsospora]|uniref:Uncharacterized protein n=1 Tax=Orbilia ellipsospora TaxID=2528407 RepID=A0AAV9WY56_9PEZI